MFSRRHFIGRSTLVTLASAAVGGPAAVSRAVEEKAAASFNVRNFGARGDGVTLDTKALQQAIETCAQAGGGTVHLTPGRYLSGTLFLKSNVALEFDTGATLLGSAKLEDYPPTHAAVRSYTDNYTERSLIYAENVDHITLRGRGVIDGQGAAFKGPYKVRPYMIRMIGCRNILVRDLTLRNSPMWVQHYLACDGVLIDGLTVVSKCNGNNDGIDIDGCERVRISNCDIQSGDDAIVLKSTLDRPCKHVVITNCLLNSDCNAFKLGTESNGGFENIALSNCVMYDTHLAGIALEMVDGGTLDGVSISNVTMKGVRGPIFVRLGNRARPFRDGMERPGMGRLRNITISDVQATGADRTGCCIAGLPDHPVENVTLRNIRLSFAGGGKEADAKRQISEKSDAYPEYSMFGILPAFGFYCRHVRNLSLREIEVGCTAEDARSSLICEDAEALQVTNWKPVSVAAKEPVIRILNVRDAAIQGCRAVPKDGAYLHIAGKDTAKVRLIENDFTQANGGVALDPEVSAEAVR